MQKATPSEPAAHKPLWVVVLSAGLIVGISMGLRQVSGLYLTPITTDLGIGREPFSDAMALSNLVWGLGSVFAGMIADRYGAGRVVVKNVGPYVEAGTYRIQVAVKLGSPSDRLPDGTWLYRNFQVEAGDAAGTLVVQFTGGRVSELALVPPAVATAMLKPKAPAEKILVANR